MNVGRPDETVILTLTREEANAVLVALFLGSPKDPDPALERAKDRINQALTGRVRPDGPH